MNTATNQKEIEDFFLEIAGKAYKSLSKTVDMKEKQKLIDCRQRTEYIQELFYTAIAEAAKETGFILVEHPGFLDGTRRKIKEYFWVELRKESKISSPESISVFLEKTNEGIHIRVSNDIYESKSSKEALLNHNDKVFEMLPKDCIVYLNKAGIQGVYIENVDEARKLINGKTITKAQACKILDISTLNDKNYSKIRKAINGLTPIYDALA